MKKHLSILIILMLSVYGGYGQSVLRAQVGDYYDKWKVKLPKQQQYPQFKDSLLFFATGDNKSPVILIVPSVPMGYDSVIGYYEHNKRKTPPAIVAVERKPLLTVHGNVMYDLFYQSNVDTPFVQKDVYQHTIQTNLQLTYKDKYPIRLAFTTRMGNSSLFRNLTDFNLQFTNRDFKNVLLEKSRGWDAGKYAQFGELEKLRLKMEEKQREINGLKGWKSDPARLQRMVEAREKAFYGRVKDSLARLRSVKVPVYTGKRGMGDLELPDSLLDKGNSEKERADSALQSLNDKYAAAEKKLDSLQQELQKLQAIYQQQEKAYSIRRNALADVIIRSKNNKELAKNLKELNLPDSILPKGYKQLLAIRSVGIGRTLVDYSELTAKNISILGVQAEYNPSYYVAFATGKVDYRFRDFFVNENRSRQYLNLIRFGTGMRDGNNVILTYYTGKKQVYNFNTSPNGGSQDNTNLEQRIMGFSLEGRWQLDDNNFIVGEVAKSSLPSYAKPAGDHSSNMSTVLQISDHSNEAYSIKASSFLPQTGTKINGMYKMMGANFQSFSLFTTGSSQTAWSIRVDQPFFKQQLILTASIKKNDFSTNYQQSNYQSNTVFKSIQATLRKKKWPVITAGYFPSSQITRLSDNSYTENMFYTLVGTVSHVYRFGGLMMNSLFSYTQFYNRQTDSNFLYFNSKNMLFNQTVFVGKFTLSGGLSLATNPEYNLYGGEGNVQYKMRSWLEIGGGAKYNYQTVYNLTQIGYSGNARFIIPKLGELSLMAEKAFIPGMEKRLVTSNNGRLTYTKTF